MAHAYYHAKSSARRFGGIWKDYYPLHAWFDQTKELIPDNRHRLLLHNSWGIFLAEQVFGPVLVRESDGKSVPTRTLAEQHVLEDLKRIPTLEECFRLVPLEGWLVTQAEALSQRKDLQHEEHKETR